MEDCEFVSVGSALPQYEEEIKSRKPVPVHEQVVRDKQGRIRFHGAFTGGFSAGHFNTVDTKEGWAPKQFKSTREYPGQHGAQRPEDFMDEEDFGEFGIAPKKLSANDKYQSGSKRPRQVSQDDPLLSLFSSTFQQCIEPAKVTVGQKLLKKLGWKTITMDKCEDSDNEMYGCSLPPQLMARRAKKSAAKILPDSTCSIDFTFQNNQFGLGYKGLSRSTEKPTSKPQTKFYGVKGQAFGVGALEEEDDDIYEPDFSKYNMSVYESEDEMVASPVKKPITKRDKDGIDGFVKSSEKPVRAEFYPAPEIPSDYKPVRRTLETKLTLNSEDNVSKQKPGYQKPLDSFRRGDMLGEKFEAGSIFDLLSEKDKLMIQETKIKIESLKSDKQCGDKSDSLINSKILSEIVNPVDDGKVAEINKECITEWEKEQSKDKAIHFSNAIWKTKFVRATDEPQEEKEPSDKEKAASKNMFGGLTREIATWHPAKLMCVRFNIEDPYPDSTVEGLPVQKHSKLSIFDLLAQGRLPTPEEPPQAPATVPTPTTTKPEQKTPASKPLAILASVDLRPPTTESSSLNLIPADSDDVEDIKQEPQLQSSVKDECDEVTKAPAPSIDIFKAIFEDDEEDDEDDEDDEEQSDNGGSQQPVANVTPEKVVSNVEPMDASPDIVWIENPETESRTDSEHKKVKKHKTEKHKHKKDKHKKDKHKKDKHKHSHKSKKSKTSKKDKRDHSDDSD